MQPYHLGKFTEPHLGHISCITDRFRNSCKVGQFFFTVLPVAFAGSHVGLPGQSLQEASQAVRVDLVQDGMYKFLILEKRTSIKNI